MAVVLYKGDEFVKIKPRSVQAYLDQGWKHGAAQSKRLSESGDDVDMDALRDRYEEVIGKKPHANAKAETMQAKIDEALSESGDD